MAGSQLERQHDQAATEEGDHRVILRPVMVDDLDIILAWWGIPEVRKFTMRKEQPSFDELYKAIVKDGNRRDFIILYGNRRIGRTCLVDRGEYQEISIYIGELSLHGKGLGTGRSRNNEVNNEKASCNDTQG